MVSARYKYMNNFDIALLIIGLKNDYQSIFPTSGDMIKKSVLSYFFTDPYTHREVLEVYNALN